jgi:hypothetical protein
MNKKLRDYGLIASLVFIIAVGAYWIFQEFKRESIEHYMDLLGQKLLAVVPESSEKRTLEKMFSNFQEQVQEKQVTPEQVEEVAAGIMNITNISDTVSVAEAEALLGTVVVSPKELNEKIELRVETVPRAKAEPASEAKKWDDLQDRLKSVYVFNERLKRRSKERAARERYMYHVDKGLRIIADSEVRPGITKDANRQLHEELIKLEKHNIVIWRENLKKEIEEKAKMVEEKLKELQESRNLKNYATIKVLQQLHFTEKMKGLDSIVINALMKLDSTQLRIDSNIINIEVK